jgi:hypothetical protein
MQLHTGHMQVQTHENRLAWAAAMCVSKWMHVSHSYQAGFVPFMGDSAICWFYQPSRAGTLDTSVHLQ